MDAGTGVETVSDVRDLSLADQGKRRMEWTFQQMPVLQAIRKQLIKEQPLAGIRVSVCLKISPSTANLVMALRDGGAEVALTSDDTATVEDDIAATLVRDYGIRVCAIRDSSAQAVAAQWHEVLDNRPKLESECVIGFSIWNSSNARSPSPCSAVASTAQSAACVYWAPFSRTPGR